MLESETRDMMRPRSLDLLTLTLSPPASPWGCLQTATFVNTCSGDSTWTVTQESLCLSPGR